jgi:hypothetical protein
VAAAIEAGVFTADLVARGAPAASTTVAGQAVADAI